MSKTIEEAAKQFTDELFAGDDLTDFDTQTEKNDAYVMCMAFGNHLMSLPLSERLTDEERERVRKEYKKAYSESFEPTNCLDRQYARGRYQVLREIFGKEFFVEGEG